MNAIEKRARELLAAQYPDDCGYETREWIMACQYGDAETINAIIAALTPPDGFVLVPVDSVSQCGCGCHRYCCRHCGTELGGHSYEPTRPEVP